MVHLSLVCRCPGQDYCKDGSGLGRPKGCRWCCWPSYTGQIGALHRLDRCRSGQTAVWF
jgi:hypothetical protein